MNKKFFIAWLATFVVWMVGSYLIHGMLLMADYEAHSALYRPMEDQGRYMPYLIGAHVVMAAAFVLIYRRGVEAKPWLGQGIRFGVLVALFTTIPWYTIYYSVMPLPGMMVVRQIAFDSVLCLILGATVAAVYRNGQSA
jgi:hypothetical protein